MIDRIQHDGIKLTDIHLKEDTRNIEIPLHCYGCGENKPSSEFYQDESRPSLHRAFCKSCDNKRRVERKRKEREKNG